MKNVKQKVGRFRYVFGFFRLYVVVDMTWMSEQEHVRVNTVCSRPTRCFGFLAC